MHPDRTFPSLARQCVFLAGPTASGKSSVSIELAERLNGEILSLDSIAVYRGMNIGTAKPTPIQQQAIPHHLLDLADPHEEFSISRFLSEAHAAVEAISSRHHIPIFVGGTPLYLKGLLRGFFVGPPANWEFRQAVEQDLKQYGTQALHDRLRQVDPLSAHRLHPGDTRRVTRALEVAFQTGRPLSHWQVQFEAATPAEACRVFALRLPRNLLRQRIDARVETMFREGLVEEVEKIVSHYGSAEQAFSRTAGQAVGYREVLEYLCGTSTLEQTIDAVRLHTKQLAKRQETWLRSLEEVRFVDVEPNETPSEIAERIIQLN